MDAGSGRLERAADRIYLILGIYRDKMPNEAVEALQGVAAALGAAQEPRHWVVVVVLTVLGWVAAALALRQYRARVPYWV